MFFGIVKYRLLLCLEVIKIGVAFDKATPIFC